MAGVLQQPPRCGSLHANVNLRPSAVLGADVQYVAVGGGEGVQSKEVSGDTALMLPEL